MRQLWEPKMQCRGTPRWLFCILLVLLTACATRPVVTERRLAVAIWDLEAMDPLAEIRSDLGEMLSSQIIDTFNQRGNYTIVERERLVLALEELSLGATSLVDDATRLKLGRIVGANLMVFGGYHIFGDLMRLDLRLVEVETGKTLKAAAGTAQAGDIPGMLSAADEAARQLVD